MIEKNIKLSYLTTEHYSVYRHNCVYKGRGFDGRMDWNQFFSSRTPNNNKLATLDYLSPVKVVNFTRCIPNQLPSVISMNFSANPNKLHPQSIRFGGVSPYRYVLLLTLHRIAGQQTRCAWRQQQFPLQNVFPYLKVEVIPRILFLQLARIRHVELDREVKVAIPCQIKHNQ